MMTEKMIYGWLGFGLILFLAGFLIGRFSAQKGYSDNDFDAFKAGYHDSYITISKEFMLKSCMNGTTLLMHYVDLKNIDRGILYYCPKTNATLPITYTKYHYITELKNKFETQ